MEHFLGGTPYLAIDFAYPGRFKPWEFKFLPNNFWNKDTVTEALKWFIEEKMKWSDEDIKQKFTVANLYKNKFKLRVPLEIFNNNLFQLLDHVYPGRFKKEEMRTFNYYKKES